MNDSPSVFHEGELAIQDRLGVANEMDRLGKAHVRPFMPDQHRRFFAKLQFIVLGVLDLTGRPWATASFGAPGFVSTPDERSLCISSSVLLADRLNLDLRPNSKLGAIGIDPPTARRNRVNGVVSKSDTDGLSIAIDQSFGNCAQHIHRRTLSWNQAAKPLPGSAHVESSTQLFPDAHALIARVDTFFIASRSRRMSGHPTTGVDVSHRGGKPGVVQISQDGRLKFPDYSGNNFFNTLGNIHDDGRVGLLFPEVSTNSAVALTGQAVISWKGERSIEITPHEVLFLNRWSSKLNPDPID